MICDQTEKTRNNQAKTTLSLFCAKEGRHPNKHTSNHLESKYFDEVNVGPKIWTCFRFRVELRKGKRKGEKKRFRDVGNRREYFVGRSEGERIQSK